MTVQEAATLYGISKQAIYQRLKAKGYDIKQLKDSSGNLTEEGERILEQLFDRTSVTGEGDPAPQPTRKEPPKQENPLLLQAQKQVDDLTKQVDGLQREVSLLTNQVDALKEERDYLRRALDQAKQLHILHGLQGFRAGTLIKPHLKEQFLRAGTAHIGQRRKVVGKSLSAHG